MLESKQVHSRPEVELLEIAVTQVLSAQKNSIRNNSKMRALMRQKHELDQQFFGNLISSLESESQEPRGFKGKVAEFVLRDLPLTCDDVMRHAMTMTRVTKSRPAEPS